MRFSNLFETIGGLTLAALWLIATPAPAQTVTSNESLVTSTFVVNKTTATAKCSHKGCRAKTQMLAPISLTCPGEIGATCTLHISLDAKASVSLPSSCNCFGGGPTGFYQFLIDGVAPTIGPTEPDGTYIFEKDGYTSSASVETPARLSYPASVLTTVVNVNSNPHTITVNVGCVDANNSGGCGVTAHWSTMRVDVFQP